MTPTLEQCHGYIEGVGRLRLHYQTWEVPRSEAALLVVHGLGEHSGRYRELAEYLAGHHVSTFAMDLRGHGGSEGRRGHARRFDILLQDLDRFRREVQGLVEVETPLFLLGHSMGGLITLRYLEEYEVPVRGAIVSSPWLGTAMPTPRWKITLGTAMNRFLPAFPFRTRLATEFLSHDEERVRDYEEDPRIHDRITPRLYMEMSLAMGQASQRSDRLRVPALFLLAGDDRLVDVHKGLAFARSLHGDDVTTRLVEGAYHEVLNETDRLATFALVRDWMLERLPVE